MKALMIITIAAAMVAALPMGCARQEGQTPSAARVLTLEAANFDAQIQSGVVLVDFWATWCGPCKVQGPIVERVAGQVAGQARVAKLDIDAAPKIAERYHVDSIPTLMVFKDGKAEKRFIGVTKAETLVAAITAALEGK